MKWTEKSREKFYRVFHMDHTKECVSGVLKFREILSTFFNGFFLENLYLSALLRNWMFLLKFLPWQNASKFAIFLEYENQRNFFRFFILCYFFFHRTGHSLGKNKVCSTKWKKKLYEFSYAKKLANFEAFKAFHQA